jgi:hypothetical protein
MIAPASAIERSNARLRRTARRRAILWRRVAEMTLLTTAFILAWLALAQPAIPGAR